MFNSGSKSKNTKTVLGIYLKANEVILLGLNNALATFQSSIKVPSSDGWGKAIQALASKHKLKANPCQLILSHQFYQKYTIDKPQVTEKELKGAIPWALKDIINEPIHEIVSDYYDAPALPNAAEKLNVITAKRTLISSLVTHCNEANLKLQGISTEEMALCNLFNRNDKDSILLSIEADTELSLLAISKGNLLFQRRLRGFNELATITTSQVEQALIDNLSLELQRSLDYLVAQLKQTEIKQVVIASPSKALKAICEALNTGLNLRVIPFDKQNHVKNVNLTALGGAIEIAGAQE